MEAPETFRGWISAQIMPVSLLIAFLAAGFLIVLFSAWTHRRRLMRARAGESMSSSIDRMVKYGFDVYLCRLTYTYLTEHEGILFPIHPSDLLDEDLGMSDKDVREMVSWMLDAAGRRYEPGPRLLLTVADVVKTVQASPLLERLAA